MSETARARVDVGRTVACQPFEGLSGLLGAEALFKGGQHHVAHEIAAVAVIVAIVAIVAGRRRPATRLPVAAVSRARYAQRRGLTTPELPAIGAPGTHRCAPLPRHPQGAVCPAARASPEMKGMVAPTRSGIHGPTGKGGSHLTEKRARHEDDNSGH
ncbi:hypothetical protein [Pandoraea sputorum]|uniref:Uncharacterized protein n=1 Tax=Pandoraea sputorum TaxID=93222 RepID=A0A5E5BJ23_9BURK|nr:hypothetical protein [Pandoraea sputorum]VVE85714.1 hypothetical protein PSP31121_05377 [Pandoraea sputorum]